MALVKVIHTQFAIAFVSLNQIIGNDENGMGHGQDGLLLPKTSDQAMILGRQIGALRCDFLPVADLFLRPLFLFFIIELGSRRVVHFGVTRHPTEAWAAQQLREATPYGERPKYLIRDNDAKFGMSLDEGAKGTGIEISRIPYRAPRANAICERFLGSVRRECLDHMSPGRPMSRSFSVSDSYIA